jgi:histidyl-tRNA synthetase
LEVHLVYHEKSADIEPSQVAAEVVAKFPVLELYEVRLNHRHILAAIWAWAGVKQADRRSVAQVCLPFIIAHLDF